MSRPIGDLIQFHKATRPDIEFHGAGELYTINTNTPAGDEFVLAYMVDQRFSPSERKPMTVHEAAVGFLNNRCI